MSYNVSAWFQEQTEKSISSPRRYLILDDEDISHLVQQWPRINREWNNLRPVTTSIKLAYKTDLAEKLSDSQILNAVCKIMLGWENDPSQNTTLFQGRLEQVYISEDHITLQAQDNFSKVTEVLLGNEEPIDITNPSLLPSELAWQLLTTYGGLSDVKSSYNPDINYSSFYAWKTIWQENNIRLKAYFKGIKLGDALKQLANITRSAIYFKEGQFHFSQTTFRKTSHPVLLSRYITKVQAQTSLQTLKNSISVHADYSTQQRTWNTVAEARNDNSITRFGKRQLVIKSPNIWHISYSDASYTAKHVLYVLSKPSIKITVESNLAAMLYQPGQTITLQQPPEFGVNLNIPWSVTSQEIDLQRGTTRINLLNTPPELVGLELDHPTRGQLDNDRYSIL